MRIFTLGLWFSFFVLKLSAQDKPLLIQTWKRKVVTDTIYLDKSGINPSHFSLQTKNGTILLEDTYEINYKKGYLLLQPSKIQSDSIKIQFQKYPDYLTKTYHIFDDQRIIPNAENRISFTPKKNTFKPLDGLSTSGSLSRGVTIGNNQNTVVNSNLDLQVSGKLSSKVNIRASIQDSNIPLQDGGYSQRLDEFDQVFVELYSDFWNVRAGDLFLEQRKFQLLNFNKKVQGLATKIAWGTKEHQTEITASGALVRGQYAKSTFIAAEGNQGPYKLTGNNGELYVLVISGSERVFVNGLLKTRGENKDYVMDYNAGEITFTSLFPVTSEMRIVVEYQYTERTFTRFISHNEVKHTTKKWHVAGNFYLESDLKNQPLLQNLSEEQIAVLQNAGDQKELMFAESAFLDSYSDNKILYKKTTVNGVEIFEFSNNPNDELYQVRFTFMGANAGNYVLSDTDAIGKIYSYVAPVSGIPQGDFEPVVSLIPPTKTQIIHLSGGYHPNKKTEIETEAALSYNDKNLYASKDDADNSGNAIRFKGKQNLWDKNVTLDVYSNFTWVQKNYKPVERLYQIEFDRDWNITAPIFSNQSLFTIGLAGSYLSKARWNYNFEKLDYTDFFDGFKHHLQAHWNTKNLFVLTKSSSMQKKTPLTTAHFNRTENKVTYYRKNYWIGTQLQAEDNIEKELNTQQLRPFSQRFVEYGSFIGKGDSTKVFQEIGFLARTNDSLVNNQIVRKNTSQSFYVKTQLIKSERRNLFSFINYRKLLFEDVNQKDIPTLTSRIIYDDQFFNQILQTRFSYENNAGSIAQQEFTYLEVEPTQGVYMWNDYNNNGIQELQEFEVAPFPDLAKYVRVFLPNQIFRRTHQNRFSQNLTLNFAPWNNKKGLLKTLSHLYNQLQFVIDQKLFRIDETLDLNPFATDKANLAAQQFSFRNNLYWNRGKQRHSFLYSYMENRSQNLLSFGTVLVETKSHQWQYQHLVQKTWLFTLFGKTGKNTSETESYPSRNFDIISLGLHPKISYIADKNSTLELSYEYAEKENDLGTNAQLFQNKWTASWLWNTAKGLNLNGSFSFYNNNFTGNALSAVGFQMLEGLQAGKNQTWRLQIQKNLTNYLEISVNYLGRKSELSPTIHTGTVQLRTFF